MSSLPTSKELLKLAKACRKAGIQHFKCAEYEITLTNNYSEPQTPYKKRKEATAEQKYAQVATEFESDSLSENELLMWSAGVPDGEMEIKGSD